MATLTYWVCECTSEGGGASPYNIRTKTKKEAQEKRQARGEGNYDEPRKHTIQYRDAFDLMDYCLSEDRGGE